MMKRTIRQVMERAAVSSAARVMLVAVTLMAGVTALSAQDEMVAVIDSVEGTVEVQLAGESEWQPVEAGHAVPIDARISTGFGAQAVLLVGENASVTVKPLTRLVIGDLAREEGVERSELNLQVGRIEGQVQEADVGNTEFELITPVATASVRGTGFSAETGEISVHSGSIEFAPVGFDQSVTVGAREVSRTDGESPAQSPSQARAQRGQVSHQTEGGDDEEDGEREDARFVEDPAWVTVTFDFE